MKKFLGTIHLRRRQIFTIFDPYPLPVGNRRHFSKMLPPPSRKKTSPFNGGHCTNFPTWANIRNLNFQEKIEKWATYVVALPPVWHTIEMFDTYPESSWYKLLENTRKSWNNQKSYITILDKNTQKRILWGPCDYRCGPVCIIKNQPFHYYFSIRIFLDKLRCFCVDRRRASQYTKLLTYLEKKEAWTT